ncbi:sensor histidine kinase [Pedobacter ginsengisoli]|uniref:sensor histidine kinase n=1 Tax=Pedobacter ginsengisoli TaxID=363852 RepID=UPI00254B4542|nr:histidine kinase [Pedobacter ginsengisoli]
MKQFKVKWKTHGLIVITLILVTVTVKYLWIALINPGDLEAYELAFQRNHLAYDIYLNFLWPQIGLLLVFYATYLCLNFFTIPVLFRNKKKPAYYLGVALQIGALGCLLALAANTATYYTRPYLNSYGPLFQFYALFGYNDRPLQDLTFGCINGLKLVLIYAVYLFLKEYLIARAERLPKSAYRVSRLNQISTALILFIKIPFFWVAFHLIDNLAIFRGYYVLITLALIVYAIQQNRRMFRLKRAEKALTRSKADLQFLRSQINPHFLFNVLNTLYGTALLDGSKRTAEGIQKLGDMMRFMLRENHLDFIPLSREIDYLHNYISLQKLRLPEESTSIELTIDEGAGSQLIVPMLLIPFVENAFKHGVQPPEKSWVKITLTCKAEEIRFEVRNSLFSAAANDPEAEYSGIGLPNVRERLNLFYPGKHELNYGIRRQEFVAELIINTLAE